MAQYYMMNKPLDFLSAKSDRTRPTVMKFFPPELAQQLHPVGRLDRQTEGLLLFTDDGNLDNRLLHPTKHVEKCYYFAAFGVLTEQQCAALEQGVVLPGSSEPTRPARLTALRETTLQETYALLPPEYRKHRLARLPQRSVVTGQLHITEGRKHQVRLMLGAMDCLIFYLKRLSIGAVSLDPALQPGQYRPLTAQEICDLLEWNKE